MSSLRKWRKNPSLLSEQGFSPLIELSPNLHHALNELSELFNASKLSPLEQFDHLKITPAIDLVEDGETYKVEVEMPGMGEEEIKVSFSENLLTIQGEKTVSRKNKDKNYVSREISYGRYERSITLPLNADTEKATASFKKGMLWVVIPKKSSNKESTKEIHVTKA